MYIEEVIIDGFKSYAKRTVIRGFDPWFNAITGLNGSGKSNILDAICFVLGISNLSQVRARSLQELVYKQGQAGVSKASVTVVFRNDERSRSPVGYEGCATISVTREVAVGGRNRYAVNGRTAQAGQVANLFHSVQLNVNNPHFLIMQGRITKVLNMKPQEVLGMVEEAAGTRMFEHKKEGALKTLEKKEAKVREIERVLAEDIAPSLETLRADKARYLRWSANAAAVSRLERFCVAAEFEDVRRHSAELEAAHRDLASRADERRTEAVAAIREKERLESAAANFEALKAEEAARKEAAELKEAWKQADREVVRLKARKSSADDAVEAEKLAVERTKKAQREASESKKEALKRVAQLRVEVAELETQAKARQLEADAATEEHREACAGKRRSESSDRLGVASSELASAKTELRRLEAQLADVRRRCEGHLNAKKKHAADREKLAKNARDAERALEAAKKEAGLFSGGDENDGSPTAGEDTEKKVREALDKAAVLKKQLREAETKAERAAALVEGRLSLDVAADCPLDRAKLRGRLAKLVRPTMRKACAGLEVAAGQKLFHVVVDDANTGKALLERGKLRQRTTVVPLDRISSSAVDPGRVKRAKVVGEDDFTAPSLEFVAFDPEFRPAVQYALGSTLLCASLDKAKTVAFDNKVRTKCVTLQGDVCNPAGTLTGGSAPTSAGALLGAVLDLAEANEAVSKAEDAFETAANQAHELETSTRAARKKRGDLDIAEARLAEARDAFDQCPASVAESALAELEDKRAAYQGQIADVKARVASLEKEVGDLEKKRAVDREKNETRLENLRKKAESTRNAVHDLAAKKREKEAQLEEAENVTAETEAVDAVGDEGLAEARAEARKIADLVEDAQKAAADAQAKANEAAETLKERLDEKKRQAKKIQAEASKAREAEAEAKRLQAQASRVDRDKKDKDARLTDLQRANQWIATERQFFGRPGGDYDFASRDAASARAELDKLVRDQDDLSKHLNQRVMGAIEDAERQYDDLTKKRDAVARDRAKIQTVIAELDEKKKATLQTTVASVDRDFGAIFASLLPSAQAKLAPPDGADDVLAGLEVKVAFGGIWKSSLSELSGGQRSLVALSLVLAMLKFKPAPMYILDEVDAALDLSHTQNIGTMLKRHFQDAQFLVVSLKEGMFNNANVLFRTKFVDGVSTVTRTVGSSENAAASDPNNCARADSGEPTKKKLKKRTAPA